MDLSGQMVVAVELMLLGMGAVFAFLAILVMVIWVMSRLVRKMEVLEVQPPENKEDLEIVAAIQTAVRSYKQRTD